MEFWREATNPWGQEVLIGISWDLMWTALIAGIAFVAAHAVYVWKFTPKSEAPPAPEAGNTANVPERVTRHTVPARAFHWIMSVAMFALLITAFFPVIGIRFPWVTIHWLAGVGLILTILYHVIHATFWQDLWSMWIAKREVQGGIAMVKAFLKGAPLPHGKAGKYPLDHKLYHHTIGLVTLIAMGTGLLMMFRVDTWFWTRNPYILSDRLWGFVYVLHGLSGVATITLVIAHIYFAIRPEKWWITLSMIRGWIRRGDYIAHHDPARWVLNPSEKTGVGGGSMAGATPQDEHPRELS